MSVFALGLNHNTAPLDLRGNLGTLTTQTGQNYSDLLVGQSITGSVTTGRVDMRPGRDMVSTAGILVFGSINQLNFNGDFNGDIISRSGGIRNIRFTDGSFRPDNQIIVNNGNLDQLTFSGGDLLGDVLVDGLRRIGWEVERPRASMFVWAQYPEEWRRRMGSIDFAMKLLDEAEVAVSPGGGFGQAGEGYLRLALVENEQRLRQAVRQIGRCLRAAEAPA